MGNSRFNPPFTYNQIKALIIIPRFAAVPSLLGLSWLVWDILRSPNRRRRSYHRLILGMSANDFISATVLWLSSWPVPDWFPTYGSKGNDATCQATAFMRESANRSSVLYSACVAIYFLWVIQYGWREPRLQKAEWWMHLVNNTVGWGIGIAGFPLELYNPFFMACSIQASPIGCTQSYKATPEKPANCVRGDNAAIFQFTTWWTIIWGAFLVMTCCLVSVYWHIRSHEQKVRRFSFPSSSTASAGRQRQDKSFQKSRKFAKQSFLYSWFFFLSFVFVMVSNILGQFSPSKQNFVVMCLGAVFFPLQGFFNCIIYLRPRYLTFQTIHPGQGLLAFLNPRRRPSSSSRERSSSRNGAGSSGARGSGSRLQNNPSTTSSEQRITQFGFFPAPPPSSDKHHHHQQQQQRQNKDREQDETKEDAPEEEDESVEPEESALPIASTTKPDDDEEEVVEGEESQEVTGEMTQRTESSGFSVGLSEDFMD